MRIRVAVAIPPDEPEMASIFPGLPAGDYEAEVNAHGAVSAVRPNGKLFGVKPGEFEVIPETGAEG